MLGAVVSGPARQLDPAALGDHVDRLYRAAWALCGSREDAEDLVQETFAKVLVKPRFLRNDDDLGYLLRVLRNTFVSRHRAAMRRPQSTPMPEELEPVDPSSATRPDAAVESREVFAYIAALPESFRDALVAVDVVGLSYGEAAKAARDQGGDHHVALVPCTRSGGARDGSDPSRRPIETSRGSPRPGHPSGPPRRRARRARPRAHRRRRGGDDGAARACASASRPTAPARPSAAARTRGACWASSARRRSGGRGGRRRWCSCSAAARARRACSPRPRWPPRGPVLPAPAEDEATAPCSRPRCRACPSPTGAARSSGRPWARATTRSRTASAKTVFYDNPKGARAAYTILGGDTIDAPSGASREGQERRQAVHHDGQGPAHRDVDAQRPHLRAERPARRARGRSSLQLAAWKGKGGVPF